MRELFGIYIFPSSIYCYIVSDPHIIFTPAPQNQNTHLLPQVNFWTW